MLKCLNQIMKINGNKMNLGKKNNDKFPKLDPTKFNDVEIRYLNLITKKKRFNLLLTIPEKKIYEL